jgi:hypothetical protein
VFTPLHEPAFFAQVRVDPEIGTITWPGGADLAPQVLYERAAAPRCATSAPSTSMATCCTPRTSAEN